jgi:glyoxylase I family protein
MVYETTWAPEGNTEHLPGVGMKGSDMAEPNLGGIHHIAINVRDVERSVQWYGEVLGFSPLFPYDTEEFRRQIIRHPSGAVLGLTRHDHPDADTAFSERRTGLDHLAFAVGSEEELEQWAERLEAAGVAHAGVQKTPATGSILIAFRDPDDIQLELYVAQGSTAR